MGDDANQQRRTGSRRRRRPSNDSDESNKKTKRTCGIWYLESKFLSTKNKSSKELSTLLKLDDRYEKEYGSVIHAPTPFDKDAFIFEAPDGCTSSKSKLVTLPQWARLCNALGNNGKDKLSEVDMDIFLRYTGDIYSQENVDAAVDAGKIILSSDPDLSSNQKKRGRDNEGDSASTQPSSEDSSSRAAESAMEAPGTMMAASASASASAASQEAAAPVAQAPAEVGSGTMPQPSVWCIGICHTRIDECQDFPYLMRKYNWSGHPPAWRARQCSGTEVSLRRMSSNCYSIFYCASLHVFLLTLPSHSMHNILSSLAEKRGDAVVAQRHMAISIAHERPSCFLLRMLQLTVALMLQGIPAAVLHVAVYAGFRPTTCSSSR